MSEVKYYSCNIVKDNGDGTSDLEFKTYDKEQELFDAGHERVFFKGTSIEFQRYVADEVMKMGHDLEVED